MVTPARNSILQSSGLASRYPTLGKFLLGAADPAVPAANHVPPVASATSPVDPAPVAPTLSSDDADLELLDNLVATTLLNRAADQAQPAQSPAPTGSRQKELLETQLVLDSTNQEAAIEAAIDNPPEVAPAVDSPELQELTAELREVSQETKEQREQAEIKEQQIALSELAKTATTPVSVSDKPVIVLPITAKSKEEARFKSPKYSVAWLWEWCKKIAKIFDGAVVYKEEPENPPAA